MSGPDHLTEARMWLRYAGEDLATAGAILGIGGVPRQACWLAQQAAEKAIKGVLIAWRTDFPRSHDLDALRQLLPDRSTTKATPADLSELTEWAVEARYPGEWPEPTTTDAQDAIELATQVMKAATSDVIWPLGDASRASALPRE